MKLSKIQRKVLEYMVEGHKIYASIDSTPWLDGVPGKDGLNKRIHSNTVFALFKHGLIERCDTERTPWWRRDYAITIAGHAALKHGRVGN